MTIRNSTCVRRGTDAASPARQGGQFYLHQARAAHGDGVIDQFGHLFHRAHVHGLAYLLRLVCPGGRLLGRQMLNILQFHCYSRLKHDANIVIDKLQQLLPLSAERLCCAHRTLQISVQEQYNICFDVDGCSICGR